MLGLLIPTIKELDINLSQYLITQVLPILFYSSNPFSIFIPANTHLNSFEPPTWKLHNVIYESFNNLMIAYLSYFIILYPVIQS